jgi:hypothetical protein
MKKITIHQAIDSLLPGAEFSIRDDDYNTIDWWDEVYQQPTEEEVESEIARLQTEYSQQEYQRLRAPEYPDLKELADALYWSSKGDNTKLDEYYAKCEAVKLKYPKPEQ